MTEYGGTGHDGTVYRFWDMNEVERANADLGHYWFSPDTKRFFHSRIGDTLYGGRYFISSECREPGETPRLYTIREANPDGSIDTVGDFQEYSTRAQAVRAIERLLNP